MHPVVVTCQLWQLLSRFCFDHELHLFSPFFQPSKTLLSLSHLIRQILPGDLASLVLLVTLVFSISLLENEQSHECHLAALDLVHCLPSEFIILAIGSFFFIGIITIDI